MSKSAAVIGRGPFDQVIIDGFGDNKSAEEVAALTNGILTPAQCLSRLQKLIKSKDVLDSKDKLALLLEDAYWLRGKLRTQMEDREYIKPDEAKVWLVTLEAIIKRIETANAGLGDIMLKFNAQRAAEFTHALTFIGTAIAQEMSKRYEIEQGDVDMIILEAIPDAIPEVSD
jgi:hypothetical protein